MSTLQLGLIGVGGIATGRHIPAFQTLENVEITAVFDVNQERATRVAKQFQIPHVAKTLENLFEFVDAVVICTPNVYHQEMAVRALEAGKHVLCEKPMAITTVACLEMEAAAKESGAVLQIGYHYRFGKEAQAAKRLIASGEIGDPLVIRAEGLRRRKVPGWGVFTNKSLQGGGCLMDYGCHLLDLALWLNDFPEVEEVYGQTYEKLSRDADQVNEWGVYDPATIDVEDHATAYIRLKNGATMLFETSWAANIRSDKESLSISGTKGGIDVYPLSLNKASNGMLTTSEAQWLDGEGDPGLAQARNFAASCLGHEESLVKASEGRVVTSIIEQIYADTKKT
ncbi:Gfo/Idh/MocA family protein [Shouchella shacheensis]|uniref:Gfo/Idh/MocA family protein n=1 Tax=Shouchella shacheensis TaxID=1649580 RepID=UPI00073FB870|nr:Gfo/Idh/MocA family oxidoreductase [Shouchella shacheensis]